MKTIYLDSDFVCHVKPSLGYVEYTTDLFDLMCDRFIEAHRLVPYGSTWTRPDGHVFSGLMVSLAIQDSIAMPYQKQYEEDQDNMMSLEDVAELVEMVYQDDLEVIG